MPLVGSFLAGAYLGFGGSGLFLFRRGWFFLLGRGTALRRRDGLSSLEDAAEEAGFSTLEELPALSEVPFEEEEAGFSSLEEAGFSSLEEAGFSSLEEDVSSLEDAGLSSLEEALELLELLELLVLPDVPPLTVSSSLLLVTVQSL